MVEYKFNKEFDEVVAGIFVDNNPINHTQKFLHKDINETVWQEKFLYFNDKNGTTDGIICISNND